MSQFTPAEIDAYFQRVGYTGPRKATQAMLDALHWAHLQRVPFENLDIAHYHRPISLEPRAIYGKIVTERRGGYCYELNGLLAEMLIAIGFGVRRAMVQFIEGEGLTPAYDHLSLIVTVPGEADDFLVDVGSGRTAFSRPLRLVPDVIQERPEVASDYRLTRTGDGQWRLAYRAAGEEWAVRHHITDLDCELADFAPRNAYFQIDPESPFKRGPMATLSRPGGRISIFSDRLVTTTHGQKEERPLAEGELDELLASVFGIYAPQAVHQNAAMTAHG